MTSGDNGMGITSQPGTHPATDGQAGVADEPARHLAYVESASRMLGLTIPAENMPGVLGFFGLASSMADLLNAFALDDEEDPAPVYWPSEVPR